MKETEMLKKRFQSICLPILLAFIWLTSTGCGSGIPVVGEVSGVVTYQDKPVTAGMVKFVPESGGNYASGSLDHEGKYRVVGIPPGNCKVAIETSNFKNMSPPPEEMAKDIKIKRPVYVEIPPKYEIAEKSGLTFSVKEGKNDYNIQLVD